MVPTYIDEILRCCFDYPKVLLAQVATDSSQGPDIRTMGLFDIDSSGRPILLTNSKSHKWAQLSKQPLVSILLLNTCSDTQLIVRGRAELISANADQNLIEHYWLRTPSQAKFTYLHQHPEGAISR